MGRGGKREIMGVGGGMLTALRWAERGWIWREGSSGRDRREGEGEEVSATAGPDSVGSGGMDSSSAERVEETGFR